MPLTMLYVLPMLLGRTFDARTNSIGVDIFPPEAIKNSRVNSETEYISSYKIVENSQDVKDLMGISGDLSLQIKGRTFGLKGAGSYLQESVKSENSVNILIKVSFVTNSMSIPPSYTPVPQWRRIDSKYLGTHFVQTVLYGGDLLASVRFKALKSEYLQDIKGAVKLSLESGSALELVAKGKLEMLQKKLQGLANLEVTYYATVPLEGVPNSIEGLKELVENFESHVKKVKNGWGVPIRVELAELGMFDTKFNYLKNTVLDSELGMFEENFDDLLETKARLKSWAASLPSKLPKEQEDKIEDLRYRLSKTLRVFYEVISGLDKSKGPEQLIPAKAAYKDNGKSRLSWKFKKEFEKLLKNTVTESEKPPHRGHSTYTRFGRSTCQSNPGTTTVLSGYLASAPAQVKGAGVNYLCLPKSPQLNTQEPDSVVNKKSFIQGIKYGLLGKNNPFGKEDIIMQGVLCSICSVSGRTTLVTFYDTDSCPEDKKWKKEYSGYLMSSLTTNRGQNICVDQQPESNSKNYMSSDDQAIVMTMVETENSDVPGLRIVKCVVCSR